MSGRPQRKRNAQAPAPPPAINFHHLNPHDRIDAHIIHTDDLADRYNKAQERIKENTERCCEQQNAKIKKLEEAVEKLTGMCTTVTGMYRAMTGELKEVKEKLKVLEEQAAKDRAHNNDGDDDDNDDDADDFRGGQDDGNGGVMDYDDVDFGGDHTIRNTDNGFEEGRDDRSEDAPDGRIDQGAEENERDPRSSSPSREAETSGQLLPRRSEQVDDDAGANQDADQGNDRDEELGPKTTSKKIVIRDLQVLLETGTAVELLEGVTEYLAKLIPTPNEPGIKEVLEILSKLGTMEKKRVQGALEVAEPKPNDASFQLDHREPNDILFFARTFEKWFIVVMKRTETVLDLKKIVKKIIGVSAEKLRCFVGENLILDCYEVQQTAITDNCVVHVMQGNPDSSSCELS